MNLINNNLTIRNAVETDAQQLCMWWNDGKVMAHAGFPNGTGETVEGIRESLKRDSDEKGRRHIIELSGKPIGEMNYRNIGDKTAEIGIKICDFDEQNKGYGTILLSMFIDALFRYYGYEKIVWDTNVKNTRAQRVYETKLNATRLRVNENAWQDQLGEWQSSIDYEIKKSDWCVGDAVPGVTLTYIHLRRERPQDHYAVEELTREAFWNMFWGVKGQVICEEHLLVPKLRKCPSFVPELDYVAEMGGDLVGHIIYTRSKIVDDNGREHETLTFGPLSVLPSYQSKGVGRALMNFTFGVAKAMGFRAVIIFGHPDYYPRVGFKRCAEFGIFTSDGENFDGETLEPSSAGATFDPFMVYPLYEGALSGIRGRYYTTPAYDEDLTQEEALDFDKRFPPKQLHTPFPIEVLLNRLAPDAKRAIQTLEYRTLTLLTTKSEREIRSLVGIDDLAIETIKAVMLEHGYRWGE